MRAFLLLFVLVALCNADELRLGAPAPPLTLNHLLQAPVGTAVAWESLKGSVVVLEFWATWCPGCRDQIPHLNRLEEQFRGKRVRFLSLTDEEPELVQRFLKDYPISGWIGLDANDKTFERYGVIGRPTTVIVDAAGVVRGIGNPADLTGEIIENVLAAKPIVFSRKGTPSAKLQALPEPFYQLMLRPAGSVAVTGFSPGAVSGKAGKQWTLWGAWLGRLLSEAYDIPEERIQGPEWAVRSDKVRYDVALAAPDLTDPRRRELLKRVLADTFQLKFHEESRESDVYVLQRRPGAEPKLRSSSGKASRWGKAGDLVAVSMPLASLVKVAEQAIGTAIIDETRLTGRFDFELNWEVGNAQSLIEAIGSQVGLELRPSRRLLVYLVLDSAVQPQSW